MKKHTSLILVLILIAVIAVFFIKNGASNTSSGKTTIGAILPMTGASAVYGEQLKWGMEYALKDFDKEGEFVLKVEDSQSVATAGISAFNKLLNENVDVFVSSFSRVSVPLIDLSKQNKKPLVMTIVSAMSVVNDNNPYAYRIFHNAETVAKTHMKTIKIKGFKKVAVVYVNDEYGQSVNAVLAGLLKDNNIGYTSEAYSPEQTDYRTQIQKIKSAKPDVIVFVGIPPISLQNFIKQKSELGLEIPLIDGAGVLPGVGGIKSVGKGSEGVYTFAGLFDLDKSGEIIRAELAKKGIEPNYAVAYGYDTIKYIIEAKKASKIRNSSINEAMSSLTSFDGLQGEYLLSGKYKQEIQPTSIIPVQVVDGKFVEVK